MTATMTLNRGSDLPFAVLWPSAPGSNVGANLTGYTVDAAFVHPALQGNLALSFSNAAAGQIAGLISWADDMPPGAVMSFRLRITLGEISTTSPEITVLVQ
jgi:hypothetical protein